MPAYSWNIEDLIFEEDTRKMYDKAANMRERTLLSLCWITGARTQEMLMLKKEDFIITANKVTVNLRTLKLGADGQKFIGGTRTLEFERKGGLEANIYLETIVRHVQELQPEARLLDYTNRWAEKKIRKLGMDAINKPLTPYHFRHSVMTWLARNGASMDELMHFKGARSYGSVISYIHSVPKIVNLQNLRRNRVQPEEKKPEEKKEEAKGADTESARSGSDSDIASSAPANSKTEPAKESEDAKA